MDYYNTNELTKLSHFKLASIKHNNNKFYLRNKKKKEKNFVKLSFNDNIDKIVHIFLLIYICICNYVCIH